MNIELLSKVAGMLGFIISVSTFILTRLERRKKIEIEIFDATKDDFKNLVLEQEPVQSEYYMKVRFTNIGPRSVILKPRSFIVECQGKTFKLDREDYLGKHSLEELMPPTSSREIGIPSETVFSKLEIKSPNEYDEESLSKLYKLKLSVKDHEGTKYSSKKYSYHEAVSEYVT